MDFEKKVDYLIQYLKEGIYPKQFTKKQKNAMRKISKHYCILEGKKSFNYI